jgi:Ca2+-binding EF-hand superfamily protein
MKRADFFMQQDKDMIMNEFHRYSKDNQGAISFSDFELFIRSIDPTVSRYSTIKIFTEVMLKVI